MCFGFHFQYCVVVCALLVIGMFSKQWFVIFEGSDIQKPICHGRQWFSGLRYEHITQTQSLFQWSSLVPFLLKSSRVFHFFFFFFFFLNINYELLWRRTPTTISTATQKEDDGCMISIRRKNNWGNTSAYASS